MGTAMHIIKTMMSPIDSVIWAQMSSVSAGVIVETT
jgi:hypothetical protein